MNVMYSCVKFVSVFRNKLYRTLHVIRWTKQRVLYYYLTKDFKQQSYKTFLKNNNNNVIFINSIFIKIHKNKEYYKCANVKEAN